LEARGSLDRDSITGRSRRPSWTLKTVTDLDAGKTNVMGGAHRMREKRQSYTNNQGLYRNVEKVTLNVEIRRTKSPEGSLELTVGPKLGERICSAGTNVGGGTSFKEKSWWTKQKHKAVGCDDAHSWKMAFLKGIDIHSHCPRKKTEGKVASYGRSAQTFQYKFSCIVGLSKPRTGKSLEKKAKAAFSGGRFGGACTKKRDQVRKKKLIGFKKKVKHGKKKKLPMCTKPGLGRGLGRWDYIRAKVSQLKPVRRGGFPSTPSGRSKALKNWAGADLAPICTSRGCVVGKGERKKRALPGACALKKAPRP